MWEVKAESSMTIRILAQTPGKKQKLRLRDFGDYGFIYIPVIIPSDELSAFLKDLM